MILFINNIHQQIAPSITLSLNHSLMISHIILGPAHSYPITVLMKPFSTSVLKFLTWVFATTTKICTNGCSCGHHWPSFLHNHHASSYLTISRLHLHSLRMNVHSSLLTKYRSLCLSAIHFRGRFIRQVCCYTLLGGCRLPWPPSCCLDESTPFLGSSQLYFLWLLILVFGSSHIASSAYQIWPTKGLLYFSGQFINTKVWSSRRQPPPIVSFK